MTHDKLMSRFFKSLATKTFLFASSCNSVYYIASTVSEQDEPNRML